MLEVARLYRVENDSSLKAFADVIVDEQVLIKGIRVVSAKDDSLFVSMPKQKGKEGRWYETVSLLSEEAKQEMSERVLEAYNTE